VRSSELLVALYESPPYELNVAPMDVARLSINLAGVPVFGALASARKRSYRGRRYSLFSAPARSDAHWSKARHSKHLNIYFREDLLEELADGCPALLNRDRPLLDVHARCITPWIDALELSIAESGPFAEDATLGLAHLIIAKLACAPGHRTPQLTVVAQARVRDYVNEHLGETIRVADLAALTDLSVGRFAQCFRASTGESPHQFVIRRRLEAAMGLLCESRMPMAEVAAACGFSSQQHMATLFRRLAGLLPSSLRQRV
jgi:AraC family transcriptional regulator